MSIKTVPTNKVLFTIDMKEPFYRELSPNEALEQAEQIKRDIERHVDNIERVWIKQIDAFETADGTEHKSLFDALVNEFDGVEVKEGYQARYERPSDNGVGSRTAWMTYEEMIETAYQNPWNYTIVAATTPLDDDQKAFLQRVIDAGLARYEAKKGGVK